MAKAKTATKVASKTKSTKVTKSSKKALLVADDSAHNEAVALTKQLLNGLLDESIGDVKKKMGLAGTAFDPDEPRLHTGLVSLDLLIGGGIVSGGWYTIFGGEQSAKTTIAMTIMAAIIRQGFEGKASYWDYEGSGSPDYIESILKSQGVRQTLSQIFGENDPETGEQISPPLVDYISTDGGEEFFEFYNRLKRILPDKVKLGSKYYYLFPHDKKLLKRFKAVYDAKYLSKHNKIKVPAEDGMMQAIALLDSYPAMLPQQEDTDEGSNAMALQARMFSKELKRIKGAMKKKRMTVFGVNQLRQKPATMFGNPEYEPGGEALKFFSDVRIKSTSRALPQGWGKGPTMDEKSVEFEGNDEYRFINLKVIKNKLGGLQYQDTFARIWVRDADGVARGIDPVFDTWNFLKMLGIVGGTRNNMKFREDCPLHGAKKCTWLSLKALVLGNKKQVKETCAELGIKPVDIRLWCKKQLLNGKALKQFALICAGKGDVVADEDDD